MKNRKISLTGVRNLAVNVWRITADVVGIGISFLLSGTEWVSTGKRRLWLEDRGKHIALASLIILGLFQLFPSGEANLIEDEVGAAATTGVEMMPQSGPVIAPSGTYNTAPLSGKKAGDLYAAYLGYPGNQVPGRLTIDWDSQLSDLWKRKMRRKGVTPVAIETAKDLTAEYSSQDAGLMTLAQYQTLANDIASRNCDELDWRGVRKQYRLTEAEGNILREISCNMRGRSLTAYAMTELLPSTDGDLNRDYFDFMLRHGGRRFLESLPALHDDLTSFGPFQFTHFAVFETPGEVRGASRVSQYLPAGSRIPGSTMLLRGDDHIRAAHLFAIHNLALGIKRLDDKQVATLGRVGPSKGLDIVMFIAVAHNKPANGFAFLKAWLKAGGEGSFLDFCKSSTTSSGYARKTLSNFQALSPTSS